MGQGHRRRRFHEAARRIYIGASRPQPFEDREVPAGQRTLPPLMGALECGAFPPLWFFSFFWAGGEKKKPKRRKSAALQNSRLLPAPLSCDNSSALPRRLTPSALRGVPRHDWLPS